MRPVSLHCAFSARAQNDFAVFSRQSLKGGRPDQASREREDVWEGTSWPEQRAGQ